jgi:hypothetical protein
MVGTQRVPYDLSHYNFEGRTKIVFTIMKTSPEDRETRANHPLRASVDQEVCVTLEDGRPTASGTFTLSFEGLFERTSVRGTAECDIVFSARDLSSIARPVWKKMGLMPKQYCLDK